MSTRSGNQESKRRNLPFQRQQRTRTHRNWVICLFWTTQLIILNLFQVVRTLESPTGSPKMCASVVETVETSFFAIGKGINDLRKLFCIWPLSIVLVARTRFHVLKYTTKVRMFYCSSKHRCTNVPSRVPWLHRSTKRAMALSSPSLPPMRWNGSIFM